MARLDASPRTRPGDSCCLQGQSSVPRVLIVTIDAAFLQARRDTERPNLQYPAFVSASGKVPGLWDVSIQYDIDRSLGSSSSPVYPFPTCLLVSRVVNAVYFSDCSLTKQRTSFTYLFAVRVA